MCRLPFGVVLVGAVTVMGCTWRSSDKHRERQGQVPDILRVGDFRSDVLAAVRRTHPDAYLERMWTRKFQRPYEVLWLGGERKKVNVKELRLLVRFDESDAVDEFGGIMEIERFMLGLEEVPASDAEWERTPPAARAMIGSHLRDMPGGLFHLIMLDAEGVPYRGGPTGERVLAYRFDARGRVDWMALVYVGGTRAQIDRAGRVSLWRENGE